MKVSVLLTLILLLVGCESVLTKEEGDLKKSTPLPTSLEMAVDNIVLSLSDNDKKTVKETSFDDLIRYHHGWGTGIRNSLGLWAGNKELLKSSCGSELCHPDDASMEIIYGVWNVLNGNDYRYKPESDMP